MLVGLLAGTWAFAPEGAAGQGGAEGAAGYAGSDACLSCHQQQYNDWRVSGHPYKLMPAQQARSRPIPLPEGYSWEDISYVVGGYKWKVRYLDNTGHIITSAGGKPGKNQFNLATGSWVDYEAGKSKKYDCGRCHTTGYSPEGHQDGLPGIVGTWAAPGIQCEACHGPAQAHVASGGDAKLVSVNSSAELCGRCHVRGDPNKIPAKGGFIQHHEQYNELLASPHQGLSCVDCHDPHKKAEFSVRTGCDTCHSDVQQAFVGSAMQRVGVSCEDCHMPMATKSAVSLGPHRGDVKTHLFRISTDPAASMFTPDGAFAREFVTLEFACLQCHQDRTVQWAAQYAEQAHTFGKR